VRFIPGGKPSKALHQGRSDPCAPVTIGSTQCCIRSGSAPADWLDRRSKRDGAANRQASGAICRIICQQRAIYKAMASHPQETIFAGERGYGPALCLPPRAADHGAISSSAFHPVRDLRRSAPTPFHVHTLSSRQVRRSLQPLLPAITVTHCNLQPTSRGTVRIRSAEPRSACDRSELPWLPRRPRSRLPTPSAATRRLMNSPARALSPENSCRARRSGDDERTG